MLSNLGTALLARFERTGQLADLDQALTVSREAVDATPAGHPDRPRHLSNLGTALLARFERTGQQADLDQAITRFSEAAGATPADHPDRPAHLSNLGAALRTRFGAPGSRRTWTRPSPVSEAAGATPADHPDRPGCCPTSGRAAGPVRTHRAAGGPGPGHHRLRGRRRHPGRPPHAVLSNLGTALLARFGRTGQQADLDQAITTSREAVDATPAGHPAGPRTCPTSGPRCWPGSGAPGSRRTWTRPSPGSPRRPAPPRPTTPTGPRTCPTSGPRCKPGSSAPGSEQTWTKPSRRSGRVRRC